MSTTITVLFDTDTGVEIDRFVDPSEAEAERDRLNREADYDHYDTRDEA